MIKISQRLRRCVQVFPGLFLLFGASMVQAAPIAFTGAEIMPVSREPITDGVLVIEDGKIVHVGAAV